MFEGSPEQISYALKLLKDPTIYAYAFFKDKDGNSLKLYPYQDLVVNDTNKRVIFAAANQIGKSWAICVKALHYALTNPGKTVVITSKTLDQAKDRLRDIKNFLGSSLIDYKSQVGDSENKTEIYFRHYDGERELQQSRIIVVPATESLLSYAVDLGLGDEIAFYDNGRDFYFQILQPRTYTTKGQIILISNPNGQQGIFWDLWNDDDFSRYNFNFLDCPKNTLEEYERYKRKLPRDQFESTIEAVFTSPKGGFISLQERRAMQEERPNSLPSIILSPLYVFFDWGKARDRTVRIIGTPQGEGENSWVYVHEMREYPERTGYNNIIDDLENTMNEYGKDNFVMVGWDNTGVGKGIEDFIKRIERLGIMCVPVEFTLQNKSRIYTLFKLLIERNLRPMDYGIKIPFITECDNQLSSLRFIRTERNYLKVHHDREEDRDDFPDALAGLCSLIIQPENPPVSAIIINEDSDEEYTSDEYDFGFDLEENKDEIQKDEQETNRTHE